MIRSAFWPVCVLFSMAAFSANANCDFQFGAGDKQYAQTQFSDFIAKEIRPNLAGTTDSFTVTMTKLCDGQAPVRVEVTMDQDYYITDIQDHHISPSETFSEPTSFLLSKANLETEIDHAAAIDKLSTEQIQHIIKSFAFFLTESARFSDVETVAKSLLSSDCTAQWLDYSRLIGRWRVLSHLALHAGAKDWSVSGGSSGEHLIAPISAEEIARYNATIAAGEKGPDHAYVVKQDWNTPLQIPAPNCAKRG